jgi:hypothetical protein
LHIAKGDFTLFKQGTWTMKTGYAVLMPITFGNKTSHLAVRLPVNVSMGE